VTPPDQQRLGDILATPSSNGHLVSRLIDRPAYGPWWELVHIEASREEAIRKARRIAKQTGRRAWLREQEQYRDITDDKD